MFINVMTKLLFQGLVVSFRLSIFLCMVGRYGESFDTDNCTYELEELSDELRSVITTMCRLPLLVFGNGPIKSIATSWSGTVVDKSCKGY